MKKIKPKTTNKNTYFYYENYNYENSIKSLPKELKNYLKKEKKLLKSFIKKEDKVLEIACGYGRSIKTISKKSKNIIAIDYSSNQIKQAKKNIQNIKNYKNIKILKMNAENLKFKENTFDKIICLGHSFGNFENKETKILKEINRILKNNGKIFITFLNQKAKNSLEQFYKNNNFQILKKEKNQIKLKEGLISHLYNQKEIINIIKTSKIKSYKLKKLTPISFQLICKNKN